MFTPNSEEFEDLLLLLKGEIQNLLIRTPLKTSHECSFFQDLSEAIIKCGYDSKKFEDHIKELNNLRQKCLSETIASSKDLFHYFIEIENISLRFSISSVKHFSFNWSDAYSPVVSLGQNSFAFEKSNILYNIASKMSNEAINSFSIISLKESVKKICISATIFEWISSNFANAPFFDISKDFSKFLSLLCLLQAQEIALFSSLEEKSSIKVLARLSLGIVSLIRSVQDAVLKFSNRDIVFLIDRIESKTNLHNMIHCIIMAEFWNHQELYDISNDLFILSEKMIGTLEIETKIKATISEYLHLSILRSDKERQQICYEGKKSSESKIKVEPYFLATLLDFKAVISSYSDTYSFIFSGVYPLVVIEAQSKFENKANTIIKTLEHASGEINELNELIRARKNAKIEDLILDLRNISTNNLFDHCRNKVLKIESNIESLLNLFNQIQAKYDAANSYKESKKLCDECLNLRGSLEESKFHLIFNDNAFTQILYPKITNLHQIVISEIDECFNEYSNLLKQKVIRLNILKEEIKNSDIRENLLGSENPSKIIDMNINKLDNSAVEVLRIIEQQRNSNSKCQRLWDDFVQKCLASLTDLLPSMNNISNVVERIYDNQSLLIDKYNNFIETTEKICLEISFQQRNRLNILMNTIGI